MISWSDHCEYHSCKGVRLPFHARADALLAGEDSEERGLAAYWKLQGDCRDYSGKGNHGVNHGVNLDTGQFNGKDAYIEVPNSDLFNLGTADFSICAWIYTEKDLDDVIGDVLSKYDPSKRKGFTLNGKLYAGSLPYGEVSRYEGGKEWTCIKRFFSPPGWDPTVAGVQGPERRKRVNDWTRVTSLTVYDGKLFASTGSCTSSVLDAPCDVRGKVFCMEAGRSVSYDRDLGPGWKHITVVKQKDLLKIHVDGKLAATSSPFNPDDYDISNDRPLKIGFGEMDYFSGKIKEVRIYNRALSDGEMAKL